MEGNNHEEEEEEEKLRLRFNGTNHVEMSIDLKRRQQQQQQRKSTGGGGKGGWTTSSSLRAPLVNKLTAREMDSLTAISDTLLPSIDLAGVRNDSVHAFFHTSASMLGTPQQVGAYMTGRLQHTMLAMLRVALWLLSTWWGTLVIAGTRSLSGSFPYVRRLSEVPPRRREEILQAWSTSPIYLLRLLFKGMKFIVVLTYFTQVNEKKENPTWKALGYCGPDPEFHMQKKKPHRGVPSPYKKMDERGTEENAGGDQEEEVEEKEKELLGPLHRALVQLDRPRDVVSAALARAGLSITIPSSAAAAAGGGRRRPPPARYSNDLVGQKPHPTIQCDAVVVGSGSGGGVVAGVLARAGYKVVVVEKGGYHARRRLTLLEGDAMDNMYEGGGLLATDDLGVILLSGSTVGGGSAINWSACIPTPEHVMEEWCEGHGLELFGSEAYREAVDAVCARMGVQSEVAEEGFNNAVLRRGCEELGYPVTNIPRNAAADHYCGWCCFGCKDGRKKGTCETWLVDAVESGNAVILPRCSAVRVLNSRGGGAQAGLKSVATGVVVEFEDGWSGTKPETYVVESRVTVVACGALNTPGLLKRSGLRNPNIGRHLRLHPVVMAWGYFPETASRWPEVLDKRSYEGGIMTAMSTVAANFDGSGYGAVIQTPALHPGMFSVVMPWTSGEDYKDRMTRFSRTAHIFALARDRGAGPAGGTVGAGFPEKSASYRLSTEDEKILQRGTEKMLRILAAAGAEEIGTHHRAGATLNVKTASSHEFERFVRMESRRALGDMSSTPICSAHQMGSCRMGVHPDTSAVDPRGESWEVDGLFVADASVFPTALGVNPMVTVQAIAYCTAHSALEVLRRSRKTMNNNNNIMITTTTAFCGGERST